MAQSPRSQIDGDAFPRRGYKLLGAMLHLPSQRATLRLHWRHGPFSFLFIYLYIFISGVSLSLLVFLSKKTTTTTTTTTITTAATTTEELIYHQFSKKWRLYVTNRLVIAKLHARTFDKSITVFETSFRSRGGGQPQPIHKNCRAETLNRRIRQSPGKSSKSH